MDTVPKITLSEPIYPRSLILTIQIIQGKLTKGQLLPWVRGQSEAEHRHGGYQDAGDDEVAEVVERPSPDLDGEGDIQVGGGAALIEHFITLRWHTWQVQGLLWCCNVRLNVWCVHMHILYIFLHFYVSILIHAEQNAKI